MHFLESVNFERHSDTIVKSVNKGVCHLRNLCLPAVKYVKSIEQLFMPS